MAPRKSVKVTRNPELIRGVGKYSRSKMYHKRGLWAIKAKNGGVFPKHDPKPAAEASAVKAPKYYPADDVKMPFLNKRKPKPTKLRASITPGTVLILLAGRFKGKRVVFLNQLASGLLLVTGPFKVNGVPLRRVNQSNVIATSTKVDITGVDVAKFDDAYFKKAEKPKKKQHKPTIVAKEATKEGDKKKKSSSSKHKKEKAEEKKPEVVAPVEEKPVEVVAEVKPVVVETKPEVKPEAKPEPAKKKPSGKKATDAKKSSTGGKGKKKSSKK